MKFLRFSMFVLGAGLLLNSCVKQKFDTPPDTTKIDPNLAVNGRLSDLSAAALNMLSGKSRVLGDTTVYGIVVADDRSGNIYKKIFIQDSSGGMQLIIDRSYLYGDYPVGRKVYVHLKGLSLTNYKGTPEIVYSMNADGTTNGIPTALIGTYIVKASYPNPVVPYEVSITDLYSNLNKYVNTLVKINNMQFEQGSANVVYSDPNTSTNRTVTNCSKTAKLTMYNSSFATFQPAITPDGNGSIVGVVSLYYSTPQLTLRDTADIKFTAPRCP
ncbi:MAG: DUF5689 domain-containing protein [Bacteroidota bacterium]